MRESIDLKIISNRKINASTELSVDEMWDTLMKYFSISEETLRIVTAINGNSESTMCDILYAVSGYRDFNQLFEDE